MRITYCSSEVAPFSKTGGLGDVAGALPDALAKLGHDVSVVTPWYRAARRYFEDHPAAFRVENCGAFRFRTTEVAGVSMAFLQAEELFDRSGLYIDPNGHDYADNLERFTFLARACLAWAQRDQAVADVLHVNDWQTALIPVLGHAQRGESRIPSVLTIHNAAYQGGFDPAALAATGLGAEYFTPETLEFYGRLNLLKGGIVFADAVTTVSPTYAGEIQREEHGCGLDGVLRANADKLSGVLNGIDTGVWNPADDDFLPAAFSSDDLSGKAVCKAALQQEVGLPVRPEAMLLGSVGRLDRQKGVPLIIEALGLLSDLDVQLVCLGSGDPSLERAVRDLAAAEPQRVACRVGFDEALAHRIEAGADAFLMPSLYEPCGLNQMYSQRYGTVPIVRATGGLADTVTHADRTRRSAGEGSGFLFTEPSSQALAGVMREAAAVYFEKPNEWQALKVRVMRIDHSWARSAEAYLALYRSIAD